MSLTPTSEVKPTDWSDQDNYTDQQVMNMTKAMVTRGGGDGSSGKIIYRGSGANRESSDNILSDPKLRDSKHAFYESSLQGFNQDFRGQNITSRGTQGHGSPFDTALSRYSGNQPPHINF